MIRKFLSLFLACTLLLSLVPPARAEVLQEIVVKEGDTLWGVANFYLKDPQRWPELLKYNRLPSSDLNVILPGMKLRVPILLLKEHLRSAHLIFLLNDVRYRRKTSAEWQKAQLEMDLYNEDGLRTLQESRAKVKFPSGETLQMDENSLIILKPEKQREEIDLLSGGVRASRTRVLASSTIVDPKIEPKGAAPDFRTKVKEDKTTLVEVFEGIVDVTAQGKTVTLTKGFGTEVKFKEAPSLPRVLPAAPAMDIDLTAPPTNTTAAPAARSATGTSFTIRLPDPAARPTTAPTARNTGNTPADDRTKVLGQMISNYHLQIASSTQFSHLVIDETKPLTDRIDIDFKNRQLPDGFYYYRIAYVDKLGFEGQYSVPAQFVIDTTPPPLEIISPQEGEETDGEFIHVEGKTEPNTSLTINGKTLTADESGKFVTALFTANGKNRVVIAAIDRAGNVTHRELTVEKVANAKIRKAVKTEERPQAKASKLASIALGTLTATVILGVLVLIVK